MSKQTKESIIFLLFLLPIIIVGGYYGEKARFIIAGWLGWI